MKTMVSCLVVIEVNSIKWCHTERHVKTRLNNHLLVCLCIALHFWSDCPAIVHKITQYRAKVVYILEYNIMQQHKSDHLKWLFKRTF